MKLFRNTGGNSKFEVAKAQIVVTKETDLICTCNVMFILMFFTDIFLVSKKI